MSATADHSLATGSGTASLALIPSASTRLPAESSTPTPTTNVVTYQPKPDRFVAESLLELLLIEAVFYRMADVGDRSTAVDSRHLSTTTTVSTSSALSSSSFSSSPSQRVYDRMENLGFRVGWSMVEKHCKDRPRFTDHLDMVRFLCKEMWTLLFKKQVDALKTNNKGIFVITDSAFRWIGKVSPMRKDSHVQQVQQGALWTSMLARPSGPGVSSSSGAAGELTGIPSSTTDASGGTAGMSSAGSTPSSDGGGVDIGKQVHVHLGYYCGLIRGVLGNLGIDASVVAEVTQVPQIAFQIKIK